MTDLFGFEEVCHIIGGGVAHQILGLIDLLETSLSHDRDSIGQSDAIRDIVGDINGRQLVVLMEFDDLAAHSETVRRVDVAERFVHQENLRRGCHGPTERNPLLLPAGKFHRFAAKERVFYADAPGQGSEQLADFIVGPFTDFER